MSGNQPPNPHHVRGGSSGWQRGPSPSPILYHPPSPWTTAPSPPPIISGPRRFSGGSHQPMSPTPRSQPMSPSIGTTGLRGTRAGTGGGSGSNVQYPKPQWPPQIQAGPHITSQYTPQSMYQPQTPPQPQFRPVGFRSVVSPSPPPMGGINGPRLYRPIHSYSPGPTSSFQLSPTPSPIVCQPPPEYLYSAPPVPQLPHMSQLSQQQQQTQQSIYRPYDRPLSRQQHQAPTTPSSSNYEYIGVPLEPSQPKSYIIYDDEEETGPTTAEIIANQSQDYVDEKLMEYQMTILQLQGE